MHYDKDGNVRNVEIHAHPILMRKGTSRQVIEYCFDITERKQAEEALKSSGEGSAFWSNRRLSASGLWLVDATHTSIRHL